MNEIRFFDTYFNRIEILERRVEELEKLIDKNQATLSILVDIFDRWAKEGQKNATPRQP